MSDPTLIINLALDNEKVKTVPYNASTTAEDVCIIICKHLNIGTLARHLFALRVTGKATYLMPNASFRDKNANLDFRIRFKVAHVSKLKKFDINAYNYYFQQARNDVLENKIPDLVYEKYRRELLGLGITDMYRVMLEKGISREVVESEYKKYVPKDVLKKHAFFIKKPIHDHLVQLEKHSRLDASFVKAQYINQLDLIAPEYLSETYKAMTDLDGTLATIVIKISPPHIKDPGIRYCLEAKKDQWTLMCTIEELGFISIRNDGAIEISRLNGIPINLKFHSISVMWSFITLLDGYYRLTCKWTFNLCHDLETPSLRKLHLMKCHGPVGGEFSYAKLEAKTSNKFGCFIIRESETSYNTYYIDICVRDSSKPKTFKLERIKDDEFIFHDDVTRYKSIQQLIQSYNDPEANIYLKECLPPSEYDVSPLLLCRSDSLKGDALTDSSSLHQLIPDGPVCINYKDLQVYKGDIAKTESNVRCQTWTSNNPHKVDDSLIDEKFPFSSKKASKNYCRNPDKKSTGLWCYTMNPDLMDETCSVPLCSFSECRLTGPGMEYGGSLDKAVSDRRCLKWDKERKRVLVNGNYTRIEKFPHTNFPDTSRSKAKKYCRNPDGDIGGPWCFVENEESGYMEKEYCDIPFCYDPECSVFTKNYDTYMHYTDFNDDFDSASARLVLSVLALPLTGKEISDLGIGIEIFISNTQSALRFGNKDRPEYEPTPGILTSTNYTTFTLNWDRGFITFGVEGQVKPIFLAEMKTKNTLMGFQKDKFDFYAVQGTNVLWNFPFCLDDYECDVQTTTGGQFQQFWPMRQKDIVFDLHTHIRAFHSASILFTPSPTIDYPYFKIVFFGPNNYTRFTIKEYPEAAEQVLKEFQVENIVDYWQWREFSISFFANSLQIYMKKATGMHSLLESTNEIFRVLRWFSVSSDNTVAHWTFFCPPPRFAQPPIALLPNCAINVKEPNYNGTQDITRRGLPCLPWSGQKMIPDDVSGLFTNPSLALESRNYCRDPQSAGEGTFCYTLDQSTTKKEVKRKFCHVRNCKSDQCKMAGTGNDFIGQVEVTRSGRKCDAWDVHPGTVHEKYMYSFNDSSFADMKSKDAKNFCRNPSRDISGSWCYTLDPDIVQDVCNVKDCDRPEEFIIITSTNQNGRKLYILPQWKEEGIHGGLRFSLKEWNPDLLSGIIFSFYPRDLSSELALTIGAEMNEKVELRLDGKLIESKTYPHLVTAGLWNDFWLQIRKGEIMFGFKGVPTSLFEWKQPDIENAFEPMFLAYYSMFNLMPIGVFFENKDECHTENTTDNNFLKFFPIGLYSESENVVHTNLSLKMRGYGQTWISLLWVVNSLEAYQILIDTVKGMLGFYIVVTPPRGKTGEIFLAVEKQVANLLYTDKWTHYYLTWTERIFDIRVTWSANCEPLDLDGPPIDGGWSQWSPWTCTVSCGGGEGFRTRTCSNPHPNIFGRLCKGNPTATGRCNDFPCGDISPETLEKIRKNLRKAAYSYVIDEDSSVLLVNDNVILAIVNKESPEAYFEWTLNGVLIKPNERVLFQGDSVLIKSAKPSDAGIYVSMVYRINGQRVILKLITLAVRAKTFDVDTRATWSYTLQCHSVILGYVYADLSLKLLQNDKVYLDHGLTTLAAVNSHILDPLNRSNTGEWKCLVEQKDLKLKWITNLVKINVKKRPNLFTHLMEDKLTAPLFKYFKNEKTIGWALLFIVLSVIFLVVIGQRKEGFRKITHVYRGMWKVTRGKKIEIALKFLKQESQERHIKDYLNLVGQWAFLKSSSIVRLFGIAFSVNDISLVMEYFKLGPLDQYLRNNKGIIKTVDLIEVTCNLASALWHLKENDIVHGKIRCRKLMVNSHEENAFTVKLADPGIHTNYDPGEVHWIPVECYTNLDKRSTAADVWAMATTLYEIFTYGKEMPEIDHMQTIRWYLTGKRLPQPPGCPDEIYTLMTECWNADPHRRKQPQEISRDVNQLLYQVYNSRKKHPYDTVGKSSITVSSSQSLNSNMTDATDVFELISASDPEISSTRSASSLSDSGSQQWLLQSQNLVNFDPDLGDSRDFSMMFSNLTFSTATTSLDSLNSLQSIFELDDNCHVVLNGRIGQGFYGDVFRGMLQDLSNDTCEPITVAVKKLKSFAVSTCVQDFEREISIMKKLKHSNIVEILGVLREPDLLLVMEYVPHGSLQSYLKINKEKMKTKQLLKYAADITMGMDYLGTRNVVHRDLAARNILVLDENHVKISDFGLAQFMGTNDYYILKSPHRELPIKWYAPESLAEGKFSVKSDVWSYGVTLFEMFNFGEDPPTLGNIDKMPEGQEQQVLLSAIQSGARFPCPEHCPQSIYVSLMRPCWEADPHERPTFKQLTQQIENLIGRY
ncbi:unnamed protein product [Ceutorhynchus assimilis]|uniref:Tyrosine-protein kinase receptor n=1 Tax=Ceutorhynchus assimilis TaxID=467358 RepID=A0A9N9ML76_9CUCU|nr:unnamed protein product [Ceutorhynchus assimilis]